MEFYQWVPVDKVIEPLCPPTKTGYHLPRVDIFTGAGDTAALDEINHPIGEELGVDAQILAIREAFCHRCRDSPTTDLQTVAVPNQRRHVSAELAFDLGNHWPGMFRERVVRCHHSLRTGKRKTRWPIGLRHALIDLSDDRARHLAGLFHKAHIRAVATGAIRRWRRDRNHGNIE